jgi:hypothetical protein
MPLARTPAKQVKQNSESKTAVLRIEALLEKLMESYGDGLPTETWRMARHKTHH